MGSLKLNKGSSSKARKGHHHAYHSSTADMTEDSIGISSKVPKLTSQYKQTMNEIGESVLDSGGYDDIESVMKDSISSNLVKKKVSKQRKVEQPKKPLWRDKEAQRIT